MNSKELVLNALEGRDTPRPACGPLAVHFCARDMGVTIGKYTMDAGVLAESVLRYHEKYRPDAVWISSDTWVTAEAMGAEIGFPDEDEPAGGTSEGVIHTAEDIDRIASPDPRTQGRQPLMLEALRRVKERLGDEVFIIGCFDQSPFSLACAMGGITEIMVKVLQDPEFVQALLERCIEYATAYGEAMAACGADMLSTGDSPAGLIGPELYRNFCLPAERRVFRRLRERTDCKKSLHICGDATELLADMATSGADVLELDHFVDIDTACREVPDEIAVWGNLDPVGLLLQGDAERVEKEAAELVKKVQRAGRKRFVLSSGCTLAPSTPPTNVRALIDAARSHAYQ